MKTYIIALFTFLLSANVLAAETKTQLKIMNFNTMCDLCGDKKKYGSFKQRLKSMADTINRHSPDLVSLQEFSNIRQVRKVVKQLNNEYFVLYADGKLANYTDPVLLISKKRFEVKENAGFWLGPKKNCPLAWETAIPRRLHWARLLDKVRSEEFIFVGTHFDNNSANKVPSATVANNLFQAQTLPVIFAGDTNIKTFNDGYAQLLGNEMTDTFPGVGNVTFHANTPYDIHDACNKAKSPTFPECRIDHVLTSKNAPWTPVSWAVDVFRYHGSLGFVSDHRAVIVTLE